MKYIRKFWVRLLVSIASGGILAEVVHVKFGVIDQQSSAVLVWIGAGITFGILSLVVWIDKYKYYYFPDKNEEDILDDEE